MGDSDPAALLGHVASELSRRRIAFIFARESLVAPRLSPIVRKAFDGVLIANDSITPAEGADLIANGEGDAVSFRSPLHRQSGPRAAHPHGRAAQRAEQGDDLRLGRNGLQRTIPRSRPEPPSPADHVLLAATDLSGDPARWFVVTGEGRLSQKTYRIGLVGLGKIARDQHIPASG